MSSRKQFETWWSRKMNTKVMDLHHCNFPMTQPIDQPYACHETQRSWLSWQSSRTCATPEWEHAPDWANWLAMNSDGRWYWFAAQPEQRSAQWWNPWGTQVRDAGLTPGRTGWTETLEPRP